MASSSVSQESLDCDDYETRRRSRIKTMRARSSSHKESVDSGDVDHGGTVAWGPGDGEEPTAPPALAGASSGHLEHDSPTRARVIKDKRCRPNHLHKNRQDKRRLREKRRSTGVVHMASTESTGDSLDDDDADKETRRNTTINEGSSPDGSTSPTPRTTTDWHTPRTVRSKSPSDLEADLEDNQDYDSTASHSETNLTLIGHLSTLQQQQQHNQSLISAKLRTRGSVPSTGSSHPHHHPHYHHHHFHDTLSSRPLSYPSRMHQNHHQNQSRGHQGGYHNHQDNTDGVGAGVPHRTSTGTGAGAAHNTHRVSNGPDVALLARIKELEMQVETQKLLVEERDNKITQLEKEISLLHQDLELEDAEIERLQAESRTLLRAMATLTM